MDPKITVIIPTYNSARFLPAAIQSVLDQTRKDVEILILDDASTDNTHEVLSPFLKDSRVRLVSHPHNIGITANRNYGLSIAKGEYIAMLDSDDVWLDSCKLERQIEILETHPHIAIVGTHAKIIDEHGSTLGTITHKSADRSIRASMMFRNQFIQSSILIRKSILEDVGYYDEHMPIWEDYELWLRIGIKYQFRNIPEQLIAYRVHESNISKSSKKKSLRAYKNLYKLYRGKYPYSFLLLGKIIIKSVQLYF